MTVVSHVCLPPAHCPLEPALKRSERGSESAHSVGTKLHFYDSLDIFF